MLPGISPGGLPGLPHSKLAPRNKGPTRGRQKLDHICNLASSPIVPFDHCDRLPRFKGGKRPHILTGNNMMLSYTWVMGGAVVAILETTTCPSGPFSEDLSAQSVQQSSDQILSVSMCGVKRYCEPRRTEIFLGEPGKALQRRENYLVLENEALARHAGEQAGTVEQLSHVFRGQSQHGLSANLSAALWWLQSSEAGPRGCSVEG